MASTESETSDPGSPLSTWKASLSDHPVFSPVPSQDPADPESTRPLFLNGQHEAEEDESYYHSFQSNTGADGLTQNEGDAVALAENRHLNSGGGDLACVVASDSRGAESRDGDPPPVFDIPEESPLIPMTLYLHRVKGLVLALLVEPLFSSDTASMEEVVSSSSKLQTEPVFYKHRLRPLLDSGVTALITQDAGGVKPPSTVPPPPQ